MPNQITISYATGSDECLVLRREGPYLKGPHHDTLTTPIIAWEWLRLWGEKNQRDKGRYDLSVREAARNVFLNIPDGSGEGVRIGYLSVGRIELFGVEVCIGPDVYPVWKTLIDMADGTHITLPRTSMWDHLDD